MERKPQHSYLTIEQYQQEAFEDEYPGCFLTFTLGTTKLTFQAK